MTNFFKKYWQILLIIILAFSLRVYKLDKYPSGLTWDEAALGYNAYSIWKTGRDEYGKLLPLVFKSFGDYKPGLYVYLTAPVVGIFGLNELTTRLPSAVFGALTVFFFYLLIKKLFADSLALIASFLLAICPWHFHFSRGAWEANVLVFEIVLALFLFVLFIKRSKIFFGVLSSLVFGLTFITYQGAKVIVPLLLLGLLYLLKDELKKFKKLSYPQKILLVLPFLVLFSFANLGMLDSKVAGRAKVMSIFSYNRPAEEIEKIKNEDGKSENFFFPIFHGEWLSYTRGILDRYFNHFSGRFLFFEGDWSNKRQSAPYAGVLDLVSIPFLIFGVGVLLSRKRDKWENFFLYWLLVAPIPAAVTRDSIQAIRSLTMVIPLIFITSIGVERLFFLTKRSSLRLFLTFLISGAFLFNLIIYLDLYFYHYPKNSAKDWLYGYKEAVNFLVINQSKYQKIVFTQKFGQPYIFYLFYSQYDPNQYQKQSLLKENPYGDVGTVEKIDNIEFRDIYWPTDRGLGNTLFIGGEYELPVDDIVNSKEARILKEIKYPDGGIAFRIVETK